MGHVPFFDELVKVAVIAVIVTVVLSRLRLPMVAGLLFAGALMGPEGFALVRSTEAITVLAEVGVVFLLFTIGLEFSLQRLKHIFRQVLLGGVLQVGLTIAVVAAIAVGFGVSLGTALFFGFVFALSSTAIVLRGLSERHELDAPHGRFIVGTLIFQDLCVVPMVLIVPLLATDRHPGEVALDVGLAIVEAVVVVVLTVAGSRFVVPRLFRWVVASGSREVFLLAVLAMCLGTAWLTSLVGLSLALGAFLGGLLVADTEYGDRAMGDVLPLKDAFMSVFFVSLGMLFDPRVVIERPLLVGLLLLGFLVVKGVLATISALAMRFPARVAWLAGVGLAQFGEFGFVLVKLGQEVGLVDEPTVRPVLAAGIFSMFLTPLLVRAAPHLTAGEQMLAPLEKLIGVRGIDEGASGGAVPDDHVVLVGYGVGGRLAGRSLDACGVPYVILELNAETVRSHRKEGLPIYYGDATSAEALGHAHLRRARALVVMINDRAAVRRIIDSAGRAAPGVPILVRTHFIAERDELLGRGVDEAVATELEGSLELVALLLRRLGVPRNTIDARIHDLRSDEPSSAKTRTIPRRSLGHHPDLVGLKIESALLDGRSPAAGRSPVELDLRARTGALLVAVKRADRLLDELAPGEALKSGDVVYLVGSAASVQTAMALLLGNDGPDA